MVLQFLPVTILIFVKLLPFTYSNSCYCTEELEGIQDELHTVKQLLSQSLSLGYSPSHPAHSCKEIYNTNSESPSGYYWLLSSSEKVTRVYCDMERTCGGIGGGWMKVINTDVSKTSDTCPTGLRTLTSPR